MVVERRSGYFRLTNDVIDHRSRPITSHVNTHRGVQQLVSHEKALALGCRGSRVHEFSGHIERALALLTLRHIDKDHHRKPVNFPYQLAGIALSTYIFLVWKIIRALVSQLKVLAVSNAGLLNSSI